MHTEAQELYRFKIDEDGASGGTEVLIHREEDRLGSGDGLVALPDGSLLGTMGPYTDSVHELANTLSRFYFKDGSWHVEPIATNEAGVWTTFALYKGTAYVVETGLKGWWEGPLGLDVVPLCGKDP